MNVFGIILIMLKLMKILFKIINCKMSNDIVKFDEIMM